MGERKFWMMYLHPSDSKEWLSNFNNSELKAYRYFLCKKGIVGMDVGWDINANCRVHIWGESRGPIFKFYFDVKKGDIILFNKKCGNKYVQAILEVLEDKVYIHNRPLPKCQSYSFENDEDKINYSDCLNSLDRIEITKCMWNKWGIADRNSLNFEEYRYNPKLWFSMIRKVKLLWYLESQTSEFAELKKYPTTLQPLGEANEHIIKKIKKIISDVTTMEKVKELITIMHNTGLNQIILYGPPGSGKTYFAKKVAEKLIEEPNHEWILSNVVKQKKFKGKGIYKLIQFHPSYTYEDFIRGIEVKTENGKPVYQTKNKIFAQMCEIAILNPDKNFVLIIDEINRANLPAVLGELIYALEYRNEEVEIPYEINKSKTLVIPKNLYIIGTMNTADRSAGRIDYAIRRRFIFYPMYADLDKASDEGRELMKLVNEFIEEKVSPDYDPEDVKIGHTYFMADGNKEERVKTIAHKFLYQVVPLIYEYIVDGLITADKEKGKGYKLELEDKNFYLRGGKLYDENGRSVEIEEVIDLIRQWSS